MGFRLVVAGIIPLLLSSCGQPPPADAIASVPSTSSHSSASLDDWSCRPKEKVLQVGSWHGRMGSYASIQAAVNAASPGDWILIGPGAYPAVPVGGGSAGVRPFAAVSFLEGIANELGPSVHTYYDRGIPGLSELALATNFSTTGSGGESGLLAEYFANPNLEQ